MWQLTHQFPIAFEFNERLLLFLADEVYIGRFGTFLCNSERERRQNYLPQRTLSLWSHVQQHHLRFSNIFFAPEKTQSTLTPSTFLRHIVLWRTFFLRHESPLQHPDDAERTEDRVLRLLQQEQDESASAATGGDVVRTKSRRLSAVAAAAASASATDADAEREADNGASATDAERTTERDDYDDNDESQMLQQLILSVALREDEDDEATALDKSAGPRRRIFADDDANVDEEEARAAEADANGNKGAGDVQELGSMPGTPAPGSTRKALEAQARRSTLHLSREDSTMLSPLTQSILQQRPLWIPVELQCFSVARQSLTNNAQDTWTSSCQNCAAKFSLSRRKHHCRGVSVALFLCVRAQFKCSCISSVWSDFLQRVLEKALHHCAIRVL